MAVPLVPIRQVAALGSSVAAFERMLSAGQLAEAAASVSQQTAVIDSLLHQAPNNTHEPSKVLVGMRHEVEQRRARYGVLARRICVCSIS